MELRKLLFDYDLSQREFANIIGVNQSEVSLFVNGKRKLSLRHLTALESHFGKEVIDR